MGSVNKSIMWPSNVGFQVIIGRLWLSLILGFSYCAKTSSQQSKDSQTVVGTYLGSYIGQPEVILNRTVNVFWGIPFAKPPVGDLRFRPPQPVEAHASPYLAVTPPNSCPQVVDDRFGYFQGTNMWNPNTNISEDCLYLNIWSPGNCSRCAVMVWIYGGGFFSGTSTLPLYNGQTLAAFGDVVVVSMQYRLSIFGFLYLGIPEAPGNQGLLDQQMAIRWVSNHIQNFGGDPERITLFGNSAGGVSAAIHTITGTNRYFNNAIIQSTVSLQDWAVRPKENMLQLSRLAAEMAGCEGTVKHIIRCLLKQDAAEIIKEVSSDGAPQLLPTIDGNLIRDSPLNLYGNAKAGGVIIGGTANEGSMFVVDMFPKYANHTRNIISHDNYDQLLQEMLHTTDFWITNKKDLENLHQSRKEYIVNCVIDLYHPRTSAGNYSGENWINTSVDYFTTLSHIFADPFFVCPAVVHLSDVLSSLNVRVYQYQFNHVSSGNPWPDWMGSMHSFELDHVFGRPLTDVDKYTDEEKSLSRIVMTYWTNLAKYGDPNHNEGNFQTVWPKYDTTKQEYLVLSTGKLQTRSGINRDNKCHFWNKVYPRLLKGERTSCSGSTQRTPPNALLIYVIAVKNSVLVVCLFYRP